MTVSTTHSLEVPGAVLTYDVRKPEKLGDHRPLFIFGSPMGASGFEQLISHFDDRAVITYDPRGTSRSSRAPGGKLTVETHAEDLHRVVEAAGLGPVDAFGSSGGGMCALPAPDPSQFGLPADDDGSRDDLLLSGNLAMPPFEPDAEALRASPVRIVPAIGEAGEGGLARRGGEALAALLGVAPVVFPGDHSGFADEWSPTNDPDAFAWKLREVLA